MELSLKLYHVWELRSRCQQSTAEAPVGRTSNLWRTGIITVLLHPLPGCIPHGADVSCVRDKHRGFQETGFADPVSTCHITVSV